MKLTDLNPNWVGSGGEGITRDGAPVPRREGIGVMFDCPCGCDQACFVPFSNPIDGGPNEYGQGWKRTGDTFEDLTLTPSILRIRPCGWHGFVTKGQIITV